MDPTALWPDIRVFPKAARRVIVTVEEIVGGERIRAEPDRVVLPSFAVDAVVHAPFGAHPTSCFPRYGYDSGLHLAWAKRRPRPRGGGRVPRPPRARAGVARGVPRRRRRRPGPVLARAAGVGVRRARLHGRRADDRPRRAGLRRRRPGRERHGLVRPGLRLHARAPHPRAQPGLAGRRGRARPAAPAGAGLDARERPLARLGGVHRAVRGLLELRPQRALADQVHGARRPDRHVRQRQQLGRGARLPPAQGAPARDGGHGRHGLDRQAALLLELHPRPADLRGAGGLDLLRRLPRRRRRARPPRASRAAPSWSSPTWPSWTSSPSRSGCACAPSTRA